MRIILCLAALLAGIISAPAQSETVFLTLGIINPPYQISTDNRPFKTISIGDDTVVMVVTIDNRQIASNKEVTLRPLAPGETNILFFDAEGMLMKSLFVVVRATQTHQVDIIDRPQMGKSSYLCSEKGCEFLGVRK